MFSGLRYFFSPSRLRFRARYGLPAVRAMRQKLRRAAAPWACDFIGTLLDANAEFLTLALSRQGLLGRWSGRLTVPATQALLGSLLIYSASLFTHGELSSDSSELLNALSTVTGLSSARVLSRCDALRKTPNSEEWLVYTWLLRDLGEGPPRPNAALEQSFAHQYLCYIGRYRPILEKTLPQTAPPEDT